MHRPPRGLRRPLLRVRPRSVTIVALLLALAGRAHAQTVDQHIQLLEKKPAGMTDDVWREKRRESARELGRLNDRKAVPALIKVIESEKFDAVAEIAIDSLGRLGDKRAAPALRKVYQDTSRDQFMRDAAANALRRLGEDPDAAAAPEPEPSPSPTPATTPAPATPVEEPEPEEPEDLTPPEGPLFAADLLAAWDRWTFAVGSLSMGYDSVRRRPYLEGAGSARWQLGREKPSFGWSLDSGAALAAGAQDRESNTPRTSSGSVEAQTGSHAEARFYLGTPGGIFAGLDAAIGLGLKAAKIQTNTPGVMEYSDFAPSASMNLGLGLGYGRILDVGVTLRLRRIEGVLRRARLLGRPVNPDVARRVFSMWWALAGEVGVRHRLVATIQILREAGVLLADPPPAITYEILRVLEDGQLDQRFDGLEFRVGLGETFLYADEVPQANNLVLERFETAYLRGLMGRQMGEGAQEVVGATRAVYRLSGTPGFWSAEAELAWRRYFYSSAMDPRGALQVTALVGISDLYTEDDEMPALGPGTRVAASLGYLWLPNRASRTLLAAEVAIEDELLFIGARLEFTYGLLDSVVAPY